MKLHRLICLLALACVTLSSTAATDLSARIERLLARTPVIDGHNDLAWELYERYDGDFARIDLGADTSRLPHGPDAVALMTDIPRLRSGHVGGQFWSVWISDTITGPAAVTATLRQIDLVKRMAQQYPAHFAMAYSADDIERAFKVGRIASLIGIEGGHQVDNSLATMREMHALGARYMTLSHVSANDWVDSATANPRHQGLTPFGVAMVREMNRTGMLVDLSHVSPAAMKAALAATRSPVMFSHSNARALSEHPRNVPDDVLKLVAHNGGVVMVNFFPSYVTSAAADWNSDYQAEVSRGNAPPYAGRFIGQPERAAAAIEAWTKLHPAPAVTLAMVADQVDYIARLAGVDHVGIGADLDGISSTPAGLDGVDKYPALFEELARRGWSDADLSKLASGNILRVLRANEAVAKRLQASEPPSNLQYKP
ncbi:MAG: dipeptidase [Pseudomonadota bacterium]